MDKPETAVVAGSETDLELVSELPLSSELASDTILETKHEASRATRLATILSKQGYDCNLSIVDLNGTEHTRIELLLHGTDKPRRVYLTVDEDFDFDFDHALLHDWLSLQRYDGIWSPSKRTAEVLLRTDRVYPIRYLIRRMAGLPLSSSDRLVPELKLQSASSEVSIKIGPPSISSSVLMSHSLRFRNSIATLKIVGLGADSTPELIENIIETVCDSLMFDCELSYGVSFSPARLELRPAVGKSARSSQPRRSAALRFPSNRYPHAATVLYKSGRDRSAAPTIRYWALYQVLEYFFPTYAMMDARNRLASTIRDPRFDMHNDDDITKATQLLLQSGKSPGGGEKDQLYTVLQATTPEIELRNFLEENPAVAASLADRNSILSKEQVSLKGNSDLRKLVANRVYDIRCKIVHSKADGSTDRAGLIPGSHDDDAVQIELPLIDFLAQKAILASASKIDL